MSMRLPDSLAPWRPWLGWLDPPQAEALAPMMLRLQPLLGAFRLRARPGLAEPEGVDDLRRRGHYERLLASEWALAEVAPEEFDRRAAAGEHLFLAPRQVARQAEAWTVAVFDTGPAQLGAPRLAHLALWILLAQRAQAARARFAWGVLGAPGELHPADSPAQLRRLLDARDFAPFHAGADGLGDAQALEQAWRERLDGLDPSPLERWSIGAHSPGFALGHRVDVQREGGDALAVTLASPQLRRQVRLPLPPPAPSVRLLRGRFEAERAAPPAGRLRLQQPPFVSADGRCVAALRADARAVQIHRLPWAGQPPSAPVLQRWSKGRHLLAGGLAGSRFGGIMAGRYNLDFWSLLGAPAHAPTPRAEYLPQVPGRAQVLPCACLIYPSGRVRVAVLAQGRLLAWTHDPRARPQRPPAFEVLAHDVLAMSLGRRHRLVVLAHRQQSLEVCLMEEDGPRVLASAPFKAKPSAGLLRDVGPGRAGADGPGQRHSDGDAWTGDFAACIELGGQGGERGQDWRVFRGGGVPRPSQVLLSGDCRAFALERSPAQAPCLLALDPDRRALLSIGAGERATLYRSPVRIASASAAADTMALIDLDGRLVVLRDRGAEVLVYGGQGDD